jgi:NDP-sugar pyrophosphorylase family protein
MIRQAVILCAGLGTRLSPFTDTTPKPMLPVLGVPLIEWNIRRFLEFGVSEFFLNLHYLPEVFRTRLGDGSELGVKIHYHFEPELLGTAGGVKSFEDHLDDEFLVIYGDIFSRLDYGAMMNVWRGKEGALGMQTMSQTNDYGDADVAELSSDGRVVSIHPKPHTSTYANAHRMRGTFILKRTILDQVAPGQYAEIARDLIPAVVANGGAFYGYEGVGYSKGIDTLEKWKEVEEYLTSNGYVREALFT